MSRAAAGSLAFGILAIYFAARRRWAATVACTALAVACATA